MRRGGVRRGFSMIEVLMAITIISMSMLPVLYMSSRNVESARLDRVRILAETICHNTLERFGRGEDNIVSFLQRSPDGADIFEGVDLWTNPGLAGALGVAAAGPLLERNEMHMEVKYTRNAVPNIDLLVCRVFWMNDREGGRRMSNVAYARHIIHDHLH